MQGFRPFVTASLLAVVLAGVSAQIPGNNVNMVTGTSFPGGDPWLQKQNEPSIAVSTRNPCTLLGGANDYRAVNVPGLPGDKEIGDAWLGLYKSTDCGQTWFSTLLPGYPQDRSPQGLASPVSGLSAGADPTVRSGPGGLFFYSFIAFNRGSNVGKYAIARFVDNNNREGGDPIQYLGTTLIDSGSAGQFLDKPFIAVSKGSGTCNINGTEIPASVVHMAWTVFVGNSDQNIRTKVYYARSSNCGLSLDFPATKLSEGFPVNQGASIAVSPVDGTVSVVWRQFATDRTTNAILFSRSVDGGRTFTKAEPIPALNPFTPFDQATTSKSFRTNAFPTMTADHTGRIHLALSVRPQGTNQARVVHLSSMDGATWTMPRNVDPDTLTVTHGHQIMPAFTYAAGRLHLVWYDLRESEAGKANNAAFFDTFIREVFPIRHTLDVRGAVAFPDPAGNLTFTPYGILQVPSNGTERLSKYLVGSHSGSGDLRQLQYNRPNLKLYAGGTAPFMGDYIDIAGLSFVPVRTGAGQQTWVLNDGMARGKDVDVFHAVWTDNRDAVVGSAAPEPVSDTTPTVPLGYAAPATPACGSDGNALPTARNANVYTSRITPGLFVAIPGNAKPSRCVTGCSSTSGLIQRAFGVFVQNTTGQQRTFRLKIESQPPNAFASFNQLAQPPLITSDTEIDVTIGPRSSSARTVYVTSTSADNKYPYVLVTVLEQNPPSGQAPLAGSAIINPDIQNPDIQNPDIQNPDIQNPDIQNNEIHNPDIQNPDIQNPDIQNPDIQNPDIQNPDIQNPDIQNPDIQNPDIQNPDIQNPDIQNPDIQNPDIQNGSLTDVSFDVTNTGNTTSTYQVSAGVDGDTTPYLFQLIGRRVYRTPTARGCQLVEAATNQILFNIPNPTLDGSLLDPNSDDVRNATILLEPGETIKVTLRAWDKDVLTGTGAPADDGIQPFCPMVGDLCTSVTHNVTLVVEAQASNVLDGVIQEGRPGSSADSTPFAIATTSLPAGITGFNYGPATLTAAPGTGTAPITWSAAASALPAGVTLDPNTGVLSGTPTTPGLSTFTVTAEDAAGELATRELSVRVFGGGDIIVSDGFPAASNGSIYRVSFDGATTELLAAVPGRPFDIAFDSLGRLIVADTTNAAIRRISGSSIETLHIGAPLVNPVAVAVDSAGAIFIADNDQDVIYRMLPGGVPTPIATLPDDIETKELQGVDMDFEGPGALIVADDSDTAVSILRINFDGDLAFPSTVLSKSPDISRVGGMQVDGENIVIADHVENTIFYLGPDGFISETATMAVPDIGGTMTGIAVEGVDSYLVSVNDPEGPSIKRVSRDVEGAITITTIKQGDPLASTTSLILLPRPRIILIDGELRPDTR